MYLWLNIFCLALFWLFSLPIFGENIPASYLTVILGIIAGTVYFFKNRKEINLSYTPDKTTSFIFLISLFVYSIFLPYPYNISGIVCFFGVLGIVFINNKRFNGIKSIFSGLLWSGLVLFLMQIFVLIYIKFAPEINELPAITKLICYILNFTGNRTGLSSGSLYFHAQNSLYYFSCTESKLLMLFFLTYTACGTAVLMIGKEYKKIVIFWALVFFYSLLRFILMIALAIIIDNSSVFIFDLINTLSLLPVLIFMQIFSDKGFAESLSGFIEKILSAIFSFAVFIPATVIMFAALFLLCISDPGERKSGKILFEESHSDWEWTNEAPGTEEFHTKSMYNYFAYKDFLQHYYEVDATTDTLTLEKLNRYDEIIIKMPTSSYSEEEISMIMEYVKNGGGLIVIGDHTNVFGTMTCINPLIKPFGMRLNFDSTYDCKKGVFTIFRPSKILPHPIVQDIPALTFLTSCTLSSSLMNNPAIVGQSLRKTAGDYGRVSFFAKTNLQTDFDYGLFNQMGTCNYGKGRVVVFTDSTIFSNFAFYIPYKYNIALSMSEWCNFKNKFGVAKNLTGAAFIFILMLIMYFAFKKNRGVIFIILLFSFIMTVSPALFTARLFNKKMFTMPKEQKPFREIFFDREYSEYYLSIDTVKPEDSEKTDYEGFYSNTLRIGYVPRITENLTETMKKNPECIVIITPKKHFDKNTIDMLNTYVSNGGKLILADSAFNTKSTSNELLSVFGLSLKKSSGSKETPFSSGKISLKNSLEVYDKGVNQKTSLMTVKRGSGAVTVFGKSEIFTKGISRAASKLDTELSYDDIQKLQLAVYNQTLEKIK